MNANYDLIVLNIGDNLGWAERVLVLFLLHCGVFSANKNDDLIVIAIFK